jgi:RNA polymerase sigma-32 factor
MATSTINAKRTAASAPGEGAVGPRIDATGGEEADTGYDVSGGNDVPDLSADAAGSDSSVFQPVLETPEVLAALAVGDDDEIDLDELDLPVPVIDVTTAGAIDVRGGVPSAGMTGGADAADGGGAELDGVAISRPGAGGSLVGFSALGAYLQELRRHSLLTREEEHTLAVRFSQTGDSAAARRLVTANLRLVVKISQEYRRAYKNLLDLIQEGNIGLIQAVQKYDPYRGVKLSSYAAWWIRAYILKFILANWRIVKIGTTQAQRKLFFNLRKEREKLEKQGYEVEAKHLAAALDVSEQEVVEMERRLNASETSLDAPMRSDEQGDRTQGDFVRAAPALRPDVQVEAGEFGAILKEKLHAFGDTLRDRDLEIFRDRLLNDEPATLVQIAERFGVTRERVRQIEERLKKRLRQYLMSELGDGVQIDDALD